MSQYGGMMAVFQLGVCEPLVVGVVRFDGSNPEMKAEHELLLPPTVLACVPWQEASPAARQLARDADRQRRGRPSASKFTIPSSSDTWRSIRQAARSWAGSAPPPRGRAKPDARSSRRR
jgi:hypothetical protein